VIVMFCEDFQKKFEESTMFNVRFTKPDISERMMHRAVDNIDIDLIFPTLYLIYFLFFFILTNPLLLIGQSKKKNLFFSYFSLQIIKFLGN
jgi:hypothetical protein